jgi:uncharacterized protein
MKTQNPRFVATLAATIVLIVAVVAMATSGLLAVPSAGAQAPTPQITATIPGTITVVGEGRVTIQPDMASANIGVEVVKDSVQEASAENKVVIEAVLDALRAQGVEDRDIQTSGFSIFAERYGPEGPLPEDQTRYRVSNNVNVKIRDLDNVGTILDAAIEAGANNIYGVNFALDNPDEFESDARQSAVEDANTKAAELAELTGLNLGGVVSVSEIIGHGGGFYAGNFGQQFRMDMGAGGGAPIAPGELELVMQLQITYNIVE